MDIDPDFAALAADPRNTVRPLPAHLPLDRVRAAANAAMMDTDPPKVTKVVNATLAGVPVRLYRPVAGGDLPAIVFAHGGGFVWGSLDTHDGICRRLALTSGAAVVSVDYRLAPEARFPAARDDVAAVVRSLAEVAPSWAIDPWRVGLCGDSAGGHIALTVALALRDAGRGVQHLALIYPALDPDCASPSHTHRADGPILTSAAMRWFWAAYLGDSPSPDATPLVADLTGLPPTTLVVAELDPLSDEGHVLAHRLSKKKTQSTLRQFDGAPHGFLSLDPRARASRLCIDFVGKATAAAISA